MYRDRICKRFRSLEIDSKESISKDSILPVYVAGSAGTSNMVFLPVRKAGNRFLASLKGLQIRALNSCPTHTAYSTVDTNGTVDDYLTIPEFVSSLYE